MSETFSSENAEEESNGEYDTLEEYIFQTQRDKEKEVSKGIRFRDWQKMQLRIIKTKLGTNAVEVVARSYLMGLSRLRDDHHDEVEDMSDMLVKFLIVVGDDERNIETIDHISGELDDYEIGEPDETLGSISDPRKYRIRESAVSEVENNYIQDAFFGAWIHRYVAALGFLDSEFVSNITEEKLSSFSSSVSESMDDARDEIESLILDYIQLSQGHWVTEGLEPEIYSELEEIVDLMETDRVETCEKLLERSEDLVTHNTEDQDEHN